jgi:hypothetical protein
LILTSRKKSIDLRCLQKLLNRKEIYFAIIDASFFSSYFSQSKFAMDSASINYVWYVMTLSGKISNIYQLLLSVLSWQGGVDCIQPASDTYIRLQGIAINNANCSPCLY